MLSIVKKKEKQKEEQTKKRKSHVNELEANSPSERLFNQIEFLPLHKTSSGKFQLNYKWKRLIAPCYHFHGCVQCSISSIQSSALMHDVRIHIQFAFLSNRESGNFGWNRFNVCARCLQFHLPWWKWTGAPKTDNQTTSNYRQVISLEPPSKEKSMKTFNLNTYTMYKNKVEMI